MGYVEANPEYDKFHAEWLKSNPFTLPNWSAPYNGPAADTDASNGIAFGDWKKRLSDYVTRESSAWSSRNQPQISAPNAPQQINAPVASPQAAINPPTLGLPQDQAAPAMNPAMQSLSDNWASLFSNNFANPKRKNQFPMGGLAY